MALIGAGYWGPNLARHFSTLDDSALVAICDLDPKRLSTLKQSFPHVRLLQKAEAVFKDPGIDAVAIATSVQTHYQLALQALRAGKHVWVEKPLALKSSHAEDLTRLSKNNSLILMVDHTYEYHPAIPYIKGLLTKGELGKLLHINAVRTNLGIARSDHGALWSLAPHDVSIFLYLLDEEPYEVTAEGNVFLQPELNIEDMAFVTLKFPSGVIGRIHVSWLHPEKVRDLTMIGTKRMVVFRDTNKEHPLHLYGDPTSDGFSRKGIPIGESLNPFKLKLQAQVSDEEPLRLACQHFIEHIAEGTNPRSDGLDGLRVVRVLERAEQSMRSNSLKA